MPIDLEFLVPGGALQSPLFNRAFGETVLRQGVRVGPYRIVREIGRGGMGVVYLAERADGEFEQTVALKLVSTDGDTDAAQDLLRRERQILARLQHPGIARLLDGGRDERGHLWFALEFVEGIRIDHYCDQQRLSIARRLTLFASVCDAVQFAHARLLIHRDIKPANILVTRDESTRLLDFGIAQLLATDGNAFPIVRALTPGYASPEQQRGEDASTGSDIYQLGVLLERIIGKPKPITSDLRAIIAKATHEEPPARYASAAELRADVENFLAHRTVLARNGGWFYRTRRFIQRHRWPVAIAGVAMIALTTMSVLFTLRLARERDQALAAEQRATRINDFIAGIFHVADPGANRGDRLTATQILERGAADARSALSSEPAIEAGLLSVIGEAYVGLGDFSRAEPPLVRALGLRRIAHADARELGHSLRVLAWLRHKQSRFDEALTLLDEALTMLRTSTTAQGEIAAALDQKSLAQKHKGDMTEALASAQEGVSVARDADDESRLIVNLDHLGLLYYALDREAEAETVYAQALAIAERKLGDRDARTISVRENYALTLSERGQPDRAEAMMRSAIAAERAMYGDDNVNVIESLVLLGNLQSDIDRLPDAIATYRQALDRSARNASVGSEIVASLQSNLGSALALSGQYEDALHAFDRAIAVYEENHQSEQFEIAHAHNEHAAVLHQLGRDAESEAELRSALSVYEAQLPPEHRYRLIGEALLAELLAARGEREKALDLLRKTLPALDRIDGLDKDAAAKQAHALFDRLSRPHD
jgi:eukaryotic-like serine/threonine-protein kinase